LSIRSSTHEPSPPSAAARRSSAVGRGAFCSAGLALRQAADAPRGRLRFSGGDFAAAWGCSAGGLMAGDTVWGSVIGAGSVDERGAIAVGVAFGPCIGACIGPCFGACIGRVRSAGVGCAARGRVWLGVTMNRRGRDQRRLNRLAKVADGCGVPLIATSDALYAQPDDKQLHDVVTCIREGVAIQQAGTLLAANAETRRALAEAKVARREAFREAERARREAWEAARER